MKTIYAFLALASILSVNVCAGEEELFSYGNIPYGKTVAEVDQLAVSAGFSAPRQEDANQFFWGVLGLEKLLGGGLFESGNMPGVPTVHPTFAKVFRTSLRQNNITLYFGSDGNGGFRLLGVQKSSSGYREPFTLRKELFETVTEEIQAKLSMKPTVWRTKVRGLLEAAVSLGPKSADVSYWKTSSEHVFYAVLGRDGAATNQVSGSCFGYFSIDEWAKYVAACEVQTNTQSNERRDGLRKEASGF